MSHTSKSTPARVLALASALLTVGLASPAAGHAQAVSPERTLLNHIAIPSIARDRLDAARAAPSEPGASGSVDGASALLARTPTLERQELGRAPASVQSAGGAQVDGKRALLGQWARGEREGLSP